MVYYINIGIDETGYSGISKETPLGWNEFLLMINNPLYDLDTFRLRGNRNYEFSLSILHARNIERWDGFLEEPWRLLVSDMLLGNTVNYLEGGLIYTNSFQLEGLNPIVIASSYINSVTMEFLTGTGIYLFKGCSIETDLVLSAQDIIIRFRDTIIHIENINTLINNVLIFINSVTNKSKSDIDNAGLWNEINSDNGKNKFLWDDSWTEWPTDIFNVAQEELIFSSAKIEGSGDYTGYLYDLFGNNRNGVGAVTKSMIQVKDGVLIKLLGDNSSLIAINTASEGVIE